MYSQESVHCRIFLFILLVSLLQVYVSDPIFLPLINQRTNDLGKVYYLLPFYCFCASLTLYHFFIFFSFVLLICFAHLFHLFYPLSHFSLCTHIYLNLSLNLTLSLTTLVSLYRYAKWLGMDLDNDNGLLWIAREGLKAPLPENWRPCKTTDTEVRIVKIRIHRNAR